MPTLNSTLNVLQDRLNQHQQWLSLEPHPTPDGRVQIQITINAHFATLPTEEDAEAAMKAVIDFFQGMSTAVIDAAGHETLPTENSRKNLKERKKLQAS